jgi:hypothetical protein
MMESRYDGTTKVTRFEEPETAAEAAARAVRDPRNREVTVVRGTERQIQNRIREAERRSRQMARRDRRTQRQPRRG